jgi:hypothetical protein
MNTVETREAYRSFLAIPTRWMDNDIYGHVNNVVYYSFFDTVINEYLIRVGGLDITVGPTIGLAVETQCRFHKPIIRQSVRPAANTNPRRIPNCSRCDRRTLEDLKGEFARVGAEAQTPPQRAQRRASCAPGRCQRAAHVGRLRTSRPCARRFDGAVEFVRHRRHAPQTSVNQLVPAVALLYDRRNCPVTP